MKVEVMGQEKEEAKEEAEEEKKKEVEEVVVLMLMVVGEPASASIHVFSVVARYDPDVRS